MRARLSAFALATLPLAVTLACSTPEALGGFGAPCTLATDCAEGFVCITQANNARVCCGIDSGTGCSNALASLQSVEDAGPPPGTGSQSSGPNGGAPSDAMSSMGDGSSSSSSRDAAAGGVPDATTTDSGGAGEAMAPFADAEGEAAAPGPDAAGAETGVSPDGSGEGNDASSD